MKFSNHDHLDWTVRTETVKTESGLIIPGKKAIIREDTNVPLSVVANDYEPFQNHELLELLEKISQRSGMKVQKQGSFGAGEKVYIQIKSNDLTIGNDKVEGYLTGINSFDRTTSLAFGPSNITISCMNTFFASFRGLQTRVRHSSNMRDRIDEILYRLQDAVVEEKAIFDNIVKLSEVKVSDKNIDDVIHLLFDIDKEVDLKNQEDISTRKNNQLSRFHVDLDGELKQKGDNLWGLFSGVTKYTTHTISKDEHRNMGNKIFGSQGNKERKIFDQLVELV
jgi:phage/plasmid-like protein (TIGR03299 family)